MCVYGWLHLDAYPFLHPTHQHTHNNNSIFSLGYLALLGTVPLAFVWARSFQKTSRHDFPKLFRGMSLYAGLVICTLHLFCSQDVRGRAIDQYVGVGLQEHGAWILVASWVAWWAFVCVCGRG